MKSKLFLPLIVVAGAAAAVGLYLFQSPPGTGSPPPAGASTQAPVAAPVVDLAALQTQATAGDPAAQTTLARAYLTGGGVKMDVKAALKWLTQATNQNYAEAYATLGELAQAGQGMPVNLPEAVRLYQLAAAGGSVTAQYDLAYLYEQGTGVKQDEQAAAHWYQLAAEGGDQTAQYDLGQRYQLGVGVAASHVDAFKWLSLAAAHGQPDATKLLPSVKAQMSAEELRQATELIAQFVPRPAK